MAELRNGKRQVFSLRQSSAARNIASVPRSTIPSACDQFERCDRAGLGPPRVRR